jgi:hypothetical protein
MDGKDVSMIGVLLMASIPAFGPDGLLPPGAPRGIVRLLKGASA